MLSLAFDCAFSGFDCTDSSPDDVDEDGRHETKFDRDVQARLAEFRATTMPDDLDEMLRSSQEIRDKGITYFLLKKLTTEAFAEVTKKSLPVIGWIDAGATIQTGIQDAAPAIKKINYALYAATAIETYATYRTNADEIKTGKVDSRQSDQSRNPLRQTQRQTTVVYLPSKPRCTRAYMVTLARVSPVLLTRRPMPTLALLKRRRSVMMDRP